MMKISVRAPTISSEYCGEFFLFSSPHFAGSSWWSAIIEETSAGSMVKDSQEPATEMIIAQLMNAPPKPGSMCSNTVMAAGFGAATSSL